VGQGALPQIHLLSPSQIQKLADRSDVTSEIPKCSKIQIFRGSRIYGEGLTALRQEPHPALGPSGLVSMGLRAQPITELATVLMIDFKYRPIYEVHIFPVSENGENVLGYKGADGAMPPPPPRIFGLEPPCFQICDASPDLHLES